MLELASPQPYETVSHTADTGVEVRGATAEEALARLVLALAQVVTGGEPVDATVTRELTVAGGADLAVIAVDVLRAVHGLWTVERLVPSAVAVLEVSETAGARVRLALGAFDRERCAEGLDVKAVTYHRMQLAPAGGGWVGRAIFDI